RRAHSFSFHVTPHTECYPLSLHDALPIFVSAVSAESLMSLPRLIQLPLPTLDGLAYPRAADGLIHQCAWCRRVLDRAGRFRIWADRKSTRLNSSHQIISYAVFCLKKKKRK